LKLYILKARMIVVKNNVFAEDYEERFLLEWRVEIKK
jgi:hypothetical protein